MNLTHSDDPRLQPRYTLAEASRYLWVNPETLRTWAKGRFYHAGGERRHAAPVLEEPRRSLLTFLDLMEAHVLAALRQTHQVPMSKVRAAVTWLRDHFGSGHPLLHPDLATDGLNIFIRDFGRLISASEHGQQIMRSVMEGYLSRMDRDRQGVPVHFFPFTRRPGDLSTPKLIVLNPSISFGRPVVAGTRIPTSIIIERFAAGEDPDALAADYTLDLEAVHEALRSQYDRKAA